MYIATDNKRMLNNVHTSDSKKIKIVSYAPAFLTDKTRTDDRWRLLLGDFVFGQTP